MPIYEYRCGGCRRRVSVFFRSFSDERTPVCEHCGSADMRRLISRVAVIKPWGESLDTPDLESLQDVDESDPKAMKAWMKRIKRELGDEAPELDDLDMLDAGIGPGADDEGDEEEPDKDLDS